MLNKPPGWEVDQDKGCSEAPEAAAARLSAFMCLGELGPGLQLVVSAGLLGRATCCCITVAALSLSYCLDVSLMFGMVAVRASDGHTRYIRGYGDSRFEYLCGILHQSASL